MNVKRQNRVVPGLYGPISINPFVERKRKLTKTEGRSNTNEKPEGQLDKDVRDRVFTYRPSMKRAQ